MRFRAEEIECATDAKVNIDGELEISTDTRTIKKGDLYLPLKGINFDGETFCNKALEAGAAACFCTKDMQKGIKVDDTLTVYLQLANFARRKYNPKVIGVTGSSGKTTTKEMIYSVVSEKFKTHKTFSNHNNEIGFCQTVLSMSEDTEVLIVEMGMRGLGEIELITKYAEPDFAVITNVGSAHIGRLGSLDNIAKAKCEITSALRETLIAHDCDRLRKFANFDGEKILYSLNDVKILEKRSGYSKFIYKVNEYELNVEGDYNIENSLSAIEIGYKLGISYDEIRRGLLAYKPIEKRWETEKIKGFNIINDSYNANPESMKASVSTFLELYENPVVVVGNMGELGDNEVEFHREVGRYLGNVILSKTKDCNIKILRSAQNNKVLFLTVGDLARYIGEELSKCGLNVKSFEDNIETSRYILDNLNAGSTIFLKASRAMKFEEIIEYLKQ